MLAVYKEALEEECDSTVNRTVMWIHIQFDANSSPCAVLCHVQCIVLSVRKLDHGIIIICTEPFVAIQQDGLEVTMDRENGEEQGQTQICHLLVNGKQW